MNVLFFDCETSGLFRESLPFDDPSQPHLVQLSAKLVDSETRIARGDLTLLCRPDGWSIEPEAEAIHGLSEIMCNRFGVPSWVALLAFQALCDQAGMIVAFNHWNFDFQIIKAAVRRVGASSTWWERRSNQMQCAMELSAPVVGLDPVFPGGGAKYPSLSEAHSFCFPEIEIPKRHDARVDRDMCAAVFWAIADKEATNDDHQGASRAVA